MHLAMSQGALMCAYLHWFDDGFGKLAEGLS